MRLNYNDMLLLAIWEYNRRQDEDLTLELFQETFGQVPGAHFHDKWVHYYNKNLLMMVAYFRGEEENGQKFCDMITRQAERYTSHLRKKSYGKWGYRMDIREISREQWNGMGQHGQIRMKFMGYGPVRIHTDNENHTVTVYRINDSL